MIPVDRELRTERERRDVARATDSTVLGSSSIPVPDVDAVRLYGARTCAVCGHVVHAAPRRTGRAWGTLPDCPDSEEVCDGTALTVVDYWESCVVDDVF